MVRLSRSTERCSARQITLDTRPTMRRVTWNGSEVDRHEGIIHWSFFFVECSLVSLMNSGLQQSPHIAISLVFCWLEMHMKSCMILKTHAHSAQPHKHSDIVRCQVEKVARVVKHRKNVNHDGNANKNSCRNFRRRGHVLPHWNCSSYRSKKARVATAKQELESASIRTLMTTLSKGRKDEGQHHMSNVGCWNRDTQVWVLGFRFQVFGAMYWGFRVWDLGFRVLEFWSPKFWGPDFWPLLLHKKEKVHRKNGRKACCDKIGREIDAIRKLEGFHFRRLDSQEI